MAKIMTDHPMGMIVCCSGRIAPKTAHDDGSLKQEALPLPSAPADYAEHRSRLPDETAGHS
jgi:hypothetical protein